MGAVTQYCTALKKLWLEMDLFTVYEWKDPDDGVLYHRMLAKNGCDFLAGLDRALNEVLWPYFRVEDVTVNR